MRIFSWNVNGIRSCVNKGAFQSFLDDQNPDIVCLQEIKANVEDLPEEVRDPRGYHTVWISAEKKGYSGVALLTKVKPQLVLEGLGNPKFDCEGRTVIAQYETFFLIGSYFPNGKRDEYRLQYKLEYYDAVFEYADKLRADGHNVIICGDYNTAHKEIDLARPDENEDVSGFLPIERAWIDRIVARGYVDTFRAFNPDPDQYSWWSFRSGARRRNVGWRIDYLFANKEFMPKVKEAMICQHIMGSDHCPVGLVLE